MPLHVGLMTGTSVDAVDAVLVDLHPRPPRLVASLAHPIPEALRAAIVHLIESKGAGPALEAWRLDAELGRLYGAAVEALLASADVDPRSVVAIGCHGQTVFHDPDTEPPTTVQLGDPNLVAALTGITTVADFRRRDMALGGQAAPLAPAFHDVFLRHPERGRVVLNLGGIANVTLLQPGRPVSGFDTGPSNTLMDEWARRHLGAPRDDDGRFAAAGSVDPDLLTALLDDPYFARPPPKSTGRELFDMAWLDARITGATAPEDVQSTLCELTVVSVSQAIEARAGWAEEVLVCGGGYRNGELMRRLAARLAPRSVHSTAAQGVDPDWLEAIAFAWLAERRLGLEAGNAPTVTGAREAAVLGGVFAGALARPG